MNLPFLDQTVELERGEAHELRHVVGNVCLSVIENLQAQYPRPQSPELMLAFPVLVRLVKRFGSVAQQELFRVGKPKAGPIKFKLSYLETVALMRHVMPVATAAFVPLGKVHQKSLNLDQLIDLT
jgi:hypothetical protein